MLWASFWVPVWMREWVCAVGKRPAGCVPPPRVKAADADTLARMVLSFGDENMSSQTSTITNAERDAFLMSKEGDCIGPVREPSMSIRLCGNWSAHCKLLRRLPFLIVIEMARSVAPTFDRGPFPMA